MSSISNYYNRDLTRAHALQNEIHAIYVVMKDVCTIVQEVAQEIVRRDPHLRGLHFQVNALFLKHVLYVNARAISERTPNGLRSWNFLRLNQFFATTDLSVIDLRQREILKIATPLQVAYRLHTKRFIKVDLPAPLQKLSCFDYVIHKVGFNRSEFLEFIVKRSSKQITFSDYIAFLESRGMKKAQLPIQSKDIIVYFDQDRITHAVLATESPRIVHAKLGDAIPFAYLHEEAETPPMYGSRFQIYRLQK